MFIVVLTVISVPCNANSISMNEPSPATDLRASFNALYKFFEKEDKYRKFEKKQLMIVPINI